MKINYDKIADALYIRVNTGKVGKTVKLADRLIVDLDKTGNILGMEILGASSQMHHQRATQFKINIPAMVR